MEQEKLTEVLMSLSSMLDTLSKTFIRTRLELDALRLASQASFQVLAESPENARRMATVLHAILEADAQVMRGASVPDLHVAQRDQQLQHLLPAAVAAELKQIVAQSLA
jgi:hypothetical protein